MTGNLFGELQGVERMLDFHMNRHGVLAGNLANADTPGYEPNELTLDAGSAGAGGMHTTDSRHFTLSSDGDGHHVGTLTPSPAIDGNGVQVEQTLAQVTANRLRYEEGLELARRRMALMRYAAQDGSGG